MSEFNNLGQELTKEQSDYFKHSKIRDDKGNLIVCYHGTKNPGFKEFNPQTKKSQFGKYKFKTSNVNYFSYSKEVATGYTEIGVEREGNIYYCYLNVVNPYIIDNASTAEFKTWRNIVDKQVKRKELELWSKFKSALEDMELDEFDVDEINKYLFYFNFELRESEYQEPYSDTFYDLYTLGNNASFGAEHSVMSEYTLNELFEDEDVFREFEENIIWNEEERDNRQYTTDDIVRWVLWMNEYEHTNYDGVILRDIHDVGPTGSLFTPTSTDVVTIKSSNQIKVIDNIKPTPSTRIDEDEKHLTIQTEGYKANIDDIIDACEVALGSSSTPISGPSYILPNGNFLKIDNANIDINGMSGGQSKSGKAQHLDVDGWIYNNLDVNVNDGYHSQQYLLNRKCFRTNTNSIESYIVMPEEKPTEAQYRALLDYLYYYMENFRSNITVLDYFGSWVNQKQYDLVDTLPEDVIKKIRKYYASGYTAYTRVLEENIDEDYSSDIVNDEKLLNLIEECIEICKKCGFTDYKYKLIDWKLNSMTGVLGRYRHTDCSIELSKYILDDPEDSIKSVILHELSHFLDYQDCIKKRYIIYDFMSRQWVYGNNINPKEILGHQKHWKEIVNAINKYTGYNIEREGESAGADKAEKEKAKYIVKCKHCGCEYTFQRKTDFVKNCNKSKYEILTTGKDSWYWIDFFKKHPEKIEEYKNKSEWVCGRCGTGGKNWEVIENK